MFQAFADGQVENSIDWSTPNITSLSDLSIDNLRKRTFGSKFQLIEKAENKRDSYNSYIASYLSDGLRVYARIDIPLTAASAHALPVLIYNHGWVGIDAAPRFNFFLDQKGSSAKYIDSFAKNGYIVVTPGWRGHGTFKYLPAEGLEFMKAWDNASYISPIYYSFDLLHAIESIYSIEHLIPNRTIKIDENKLYLSSHSQGGDSALLALAISGDNPNLRYSVSAASFFSACILPRLIQGELYGAMAITSEAFMSGDGTWTASSTGKNGQVNPDFLFHYPPDWIATTNKEQWTWQNNVWKVDTVAQAYQEKYDEMYSVLRKQGLTIGNFKIFKSSSGKTQITHLDAIKEAYANTSAIYFTHYINTPISLHYSDRDYYSPPFWNNYLAEQLKKNGTPVKAFEYAGNTHSLTVSDHHWFSQPNTVEGLSRMIQQDMQTFSSID